MMHRDVKLKDVILRPCLGQCNTLFICWGREECSLFKACWATDKIDYKEKIEKNVWVADDGRKEGRENGLDYLLK